MVSPSDGEHSKALKRKAREEWIRLITRTREMTPDHQTKGWGSDNPTAQQFGYNDLTIASQRDIAPVIRGNVGGRYKVKKWQGVSEEPVKMRAKK